MGALTLVPLARDSTLAARVRALARARSPLPPRPVDIRSVSMLAPRARRRSCTTSRRTRLPVVARCRTASSLPPVAPTPPNRTPRRGWRASASPSPRRSSLRARSPKTSPRWAFRASSTASCASTRAATSIRPAKLWCDTESAAEADELGAVFGWAMQAGFTSSKALWLKRNEPDAWDATRAVLLPHDYVNYRLTGVLAMEAGDASGIGVMDLTTRAFRSEPVGATPSTPNSPPRSRISFPPRLARRNCRRHVRDPRRSRGACPCPWVRGIT